MLEFCTLGTGGTLPIPERSLASLYVRVNGYSLLVDCGEGTQVGVRRLGWGFRCIDGILLTHFHGDHCTGLAGMLLSLEKAGRTDPVHIWGPHGLKRVVEGLCIIVPPLSFNVILHEIPNVGTEFEMIGITIRAFPVNHGGMPCFGYRFELKRAPAFDADKAKKLDIPMKDWKSLQLGESVTVNGHEYSLQDVALKERKGITFVYCTDTRPCETLVKNCKGADMLMLEGMYGDPEKIQQALKNHHMMMTEAAEIAAGSGTSKLFLTHYSTSVENPEDYIDEIKAIFPETILSTDGMKGFMRYPKEQEAAWTSLY